MGWPNSRWSCSIWSTFPLVSGAGPLNVAIRIWRRHVDRILTPPAVSGIAVPKNILESTRLLKDYSAQLKESLGELVASLDISGEESGRLMELTTTELQFLMSDRDDYAEERDRGVRFRDAVELPDGEQVFVGQGPAGVIWTSAGRVDSFVTDGPTQQAARRVRRVINDFVRRSWL